MPSPRVFLVGAGPGDPSLMTVRGMECLRRADVVLYDHRVHARLLEAAPAAAERIDVGAAAPKPMEQDAISYLLAEKAREGKIVVRLKWGDPFLFDSGGKEALFLHEQRIPFEVIPGIPVASAAAAYAGIPLTYPDAGDIVVLVRGNEAETDTPAHVDWAHVAALGGTLACHASARQASEIARALIGHGMSADEPAALVHAGTTPSQQTVQGTLGEIAGRSPAPGPALLVVGRVAAFRRHLQWFDTRPLFGRRIVVTRSADQAGELVRRLEDLGAETIAMPTIEIRQIEDFTAVDAAIDDVEAFDWIVFTSANGVDHFLPRFLARRDIRDLRGVRLCAVGPATTAAVEHYGLRVDLTPAEYRAEAVVDALTSGGHAAGRRFLLPRADIARDLLVDELRQAGADVLDLPVYRTVEAAESAGQEVYRQLLERTIDAVTFTSASTVRHFARILGEDQAVDLLRTTTVAAIGPVTAEAAQQLGITAQVVPPEYTIRSLADALADYFRKRPHPAGVA